jgi:hypothetical protein
MGRIEREGTYQGPVLEHGMQETKNGFPAWVARIAAHRYYVEEHEREDGLE